MRIRSVVAPCGHDGVIFQLKNGVSTWVEFIQRIQAMIEIHFPEAEFKLELRRRPKQGRFSIQILSNTIN